MTKNWNATWEEQASAPSTAASTKWKVYFKSTGLFVLDDAGLEHGPFHSSQLVNAIGSIGGGTQDIDLESGNAISGTVDTSTTTFTFSNPPASGLLGTLTLILTNGGSQTVNWPASVDWAGGVAPTLTAAGVDLLNFITVDGGTIWHGVATGLDMK